MDRLHRVIRRPIYTEKSTVMQEEDNQYVFEVDRNATKQQIADAIEKLFDVSVTSVRTQNYMGKNRRMGMFEGRTPAWKKAIVSLAEGDTIELYESV